MGELAGPPADRRAALRAFALLVGASLALVLYSIYRLALVWPLTSPPRGPLRDAGAPAPASLAPPSGG